MSSVRTKVEQRDPFTGTQTSCPPQRRVVAKGKKRKYEAVASTNAMSTSSYQPVVKRPKSFGVSPQRLMDSFFQAMKEIIENKARPIIDKPSKLDALKKTLLSAKRLPLGVITTAEKICQCAKDELKNHLEHHGTKQNFQYLQEYVKDHFDAIVVSLQLQASTSTSTGESASIPATPVIAPSDSVAFLRRDLSGMDMASDISSVSGAPSHAAMSSISHNPSDISMVEAPPDNVGYRTCTVSFKSLLRKGVPSRGTSWFGADFWRSQKSRAKVTESCRKSFPSTWCHFGNLKRPTSRKITFQMHTDFAVFCLFSSSKR